MMDYLQCTAAFFCSSRHISKCFVAHLLHLLRIYIVQVDIRRGHTTEAQLLGVQSNLIEYFGEEGWSGAWRQVDTDVIHWCTRQCHRYSHQRVDGITVEGHHHQEYTAQTVDHWEEQGQLNRPVQLRSFEAKVDKAGY